MDFVDKLQDVGEWVLLGLGALSAMLHVVAPFTKTKKDDEVKRWTDKVADKLKWAVVPRKLNK